MQLNAAIAVWPLATTAWTRIRAALERRLNMKGQARLFWATPNDGKH